MKKRGLASENFRMDGGRVWKTKDKINEPKAARARERMLERENKPTESIKTHEDSLTDEIVKDYMGGSDAARKQSESYKKVFDNIKTGNGTTHEAGSLAEAARKRMIERDNTEKDKKVYPDIGRDRANRRAYPAQ